MIPAAATEFRQPYPPIRPPPHRPCATMKPCPRERAAPPFSAQAEVSRFRQTEHHSASVNSPRKRRPMRPALRRGASSRLVYELGGALLQALDR